MSIVRINDNTLEIGPKRSAGWIIFAIIYLLIVSAGLYSFTIQKYTKPIPVYLILVFILYFAIMYLIGMNCLLVNLFRKTSLAINEGILKIDSTMSLEKEMQFKLSEITSIKSEIQTGFIHFLYRVNGKFKVIVVTNGKSNPIYFDLEKEDADELISFIQKQRGQTC